MEDIMKTKCLLFTVTALLLIFAGCNKEDFTEDYSNSNPDLKKAQVPIPMKGEICMVGVEEDRLTVHFGSPDGPVVPGVDLSRSAWLNGNMTHTGKMGAQSFMTGREGAYIDADAYSKGKIIIVATYDVRIFAAHGDYLDLYSEILIDATDSNNRLITGDTHINGGTGVFENASGLGYLSGVIPCWEVDGKIEFD
jgi:hypothetical protein